jgi:hypothetical protein
MRYRPPSRPPARYTHTHTHTCWRTRASWKCSKKGSAPDPRNASLM